ncbi:hypothetical protein AVEN_261692-1 [Araneus ventricosus]|uniref:Uncharacterized protein n=1 Tax=Araneus ventricosus TaxID=182803 RepID=A0A4Y2DXN4_ARAVE|nr:hypothetical protein AVEN_261692-1 [Araneus ventricosus]
MRTSVGALRGQQQQRQKDTSGPFAVNHVNLQLHFSLGSPASLAGALRKRSFSLRVLNWTDKNQSPTLGGEERPSPTSVV